VRVSSACLTISCPSSIIGCLGAESFPSPSNLLSPKSKSRTMIPGAGLYLPQSSHVNYNAATNRTEARPLKHKYFERTSAMQGTDKNLNSSRTPSRTSLALSRKSTEDITKVFSSLSTVFDFADYASSHDKVTSDSEVFVNLLQRVRQDVTEASRLYTSQAVTDYFESWPDKKSYVDAILSDIQRALNDIGVFMETVRVSGDDGGSAGLKRKFEWVLSHHKKLIGKQQNLTVCHQSLMTAVHVMMTAEMNVAFNGQDPVYEAPTRPWIPEDARDIFRSPHSRQKWRLGQRNLSLPSIVVSDTEDDKFGGMLSIYHRSNVSANISLVETVNSAPVELPGSTPDDLPHPDNLDLYAPPPPKQRSASMDEDRIDRPSFWTTPATSMLDTIPSPNAPILYLESLKQPPSTSDPTRRSLDQVPTLASSAQQKPRTFFNQSRPRAYSDRAPTLTSFATKPRASIDQARALPTLNERPLERYDSNASVSVTEAATVPLTTMRYRPKAVNVRRPPTKHHSAPSTLPSLSGQTSLMDDLSNWVLPSVARDSFHSNESPVSVAISTPSTSIASSPVSIHSATSYPRISKGLGHSAAPAVTGSSPTITSIMPSSQTSHAHTVQGPPLPSRPPPQVPHVTIRAETQKSSLPATPQNSVRLALSPKSRDTEKIVLKAATSTQSPITAEETPPPLPLRPRTRITEQSTVPVPQTDSVPEHQASASPKSAEAIVQNAAEHVSPGILAAEAKKPITATSSSAVVNHSTHSNTGPVNPTVPAVSPQPAVPVLLPPPVPTTPSQPMSAQARRRAAHARRMQLAFGAEQKKAPGEGAGG
jgi:hypothetical protein